VNYTRHWLRLRDSSSERVSLGLAQWRTHAARWTVRHVAELRGMCACGHMAEHHEEARVRRLGHAGVGEAEEITSHWACARSPLDARALATVGASACRCVGFVPAPLCAACGSPRDEHVIGDRDRAVARGRMPGPWREAGCDLYQPPDECGDECDHSHD